MAGEIKFFSIRIGYSSVIGIGKGVNCHGSFLGHLLSFGWFPTGLAGIWGVGAGAGAWVGTGAGIGLVCIGCMVKVGRVYLGLPLFLPII